MGIGMITKLNEEMNHERLRLIAFGRAKEKELGRKPGELFSTVLFTKGLSKGQGVRMGYYRNDDKAIRIYDRYLCKGRAYTDELMLHELAHGFDLATEGYTERSNCHDERFVIAARALGADVSRYLKGSKEKMVEEALEKERWQSYIPPEFQNLPDDRNSYSLIFNISKRPSLICRSCFLMTLVFADIYGDWQKDYWRFEGKYVMCGWGSYESLKLAQEIFTELEMSVRKISRKSEPTFPLDNKGGIVIGIKYGFISILKEQGFRRAVDFDFSSVDRMKKGHKNNKDLAICDHPLWPISIKDFWNGFDEGRLLAERILNEWQV